MSNQETSKCPFTSGSFTAADMGTANFNWWPNNLNIKILHNNPQTGVPQDPDFDYAKEFEWSKIIDEYYVPAMNKIIERYQ